MNLQAGADEPGTQTCNSNAGVMSATKASTAPDTGAEELLSITSPASWVALGGLLLLVLGALAWSYFGRMPVDLSGRAVLLPKGGLTRVQAPVSGLVTSFTAREGNKVNEGQALAIMAPVGRDVPIPETALTISSPVEGVVLQHLVDQGNFVTAGTAVSLVSDGSDSELVAWVFVPFENAGDIDVGMPVYVAIDTLAAEENGYVEGRVTEVGRFPVTADRLTVTFGKDPDWIRFLLGGDEPHALVKVDLVKSSSDPTGYSWTMGRGPETTLTNGMVGTGMIRVSYARPLDAAVPKHGGKKK